MGQPDNEWIPVARMQERFKDGRVVFVWDGERPYICRYYSHTPSWSGIFTEGWEVVDDYHPAGGVIDVAKVTHFAPMMLGPSHEEAVF